MLTTLHTELTPQPIREEITYLLDILRRYKAIKNMPIERRIDELRKWESQLPELELKLV